jgi:undecaprenyl-phosphate galactose phosphotransferase/putative colanic acid biosynthesis UDP-glucose lipid carrier transferase
MSDLPSTHSSAAIYGHLAKKPGGPSFLAISFGSVGPLCALIDALLVVVAGVLGPALYSGIPGSAGDDLLVAGIGGLSALAYLMAAWCLKAHSVFDQQTARGYLRVVGSWLFATLFVALALFLLKAGANVSRGAVVCSSGLSLFLLVASRLVAKKLIRSALVNGAIRGRRAILIGTQDELIHLNSNYLLLSHGLQELERVTIPSRSPGAVGGQKVDCEAVTLLFDKARQSKADEILVALPWAQSTQLQLLLEQLRACPLPVQLIPDNSIRSIVEKGGSRAALFEVQRAPLTRYEQALKRSFDLIAAISILFMLSPILVITALAIKFDSPGEVLFRQRRKGFNGREFRIFKFRTMKVQEDGPVIVQAVCSDPRVTRLGRVLRRYSIDELPQLFNVLTGDMAIVGPRPHALAHDDEYGKVIANYAFRHHVKPGITGWAQVHGYRGATPQVQFMKQRVDSDLWYINNWSMWLDLQIVTRTFFELARARNAD